MLTIQELLGEDKIMRTRAQMQRLLFLGSLVSVTAFWVSPVWTAAATVGAVVLQKLIGFARSGGSSWRDWERYGRASTRAILAVMPPLTGWDLFLIATSYPAMTVGGTFKVLFKRPWTVLGVGVHEVLSAELAFDEKDRQLFERLGKTPFRTRAFEDHARLQRLAAFGLAARCSDGWTRGPHWTVRWSLEKNGEV
jgi:hypothetical protein